MKPAALHIDFAPGARRVSWIGRGLLVAGAVLLAAGLAQGGRLLEQRTQATSALADVEAHRTRGAATPAARKPDARQVALIRATNQVADDLTTPWSRLLASLGSTGKEVALLSVEPSVAKRSVRLTAEARDATGMLDYLAALQHDARLSYVVLLSHQIQLQAPGTPIRFQVQAQWGDTP